MTQHPTPPRDPLTTALNLARSGVPVLPLRAGKAPFGNCPACTKNACGGRPNMKQTGPCTCPKPCHAWAAATTDPTVINSREWAGAWREAAAVAYHPAGARLTVVDLDNTDAVAWAQAHLPPTRTVTTTRGQHWIYRGTMRSTHDVRPGVDIKSLMQYARWLGPGTGRMILLPDAVRTLIAREEATARPTPGVASSTPAREAWHRTVATGCRHTASYVHTGLDRGVAMVLARTESGAGTQAYSVAAFLARQHAACPGPCGLDTLTEPIVAAAVSVGVPEPYARRAVTNGLAHTTGEAA
ncbi:DNA primase [Streptomyces triticagri]|uniref:DNA primase n=1 Tax=Streptomyces triticagri TaxID=2293568 RepID=A0A372LYA2_9ACTN|nr:bifunctional DNA primase/polymerase [Streptomyces triticagri]RFU83265.1 DNA primase [Streptomyces triticagri]